jgi:hypothetical protein
MLNNLGFLGFLIGLILFAVFIGVCMKGTNYIGNAFRKLIRYLLNLLQKKRNN